MISNEFIDLLKAIIRQPSIELANQQLLVLREKDANATFNKRAKLLIEEMCQCQHLSYLFEDRYVEAHNARLQRLGEKPHSLGSKEMGRIIAASNGLVDGTTIQIPTTGYHTMEESASLESVTAFISLLMMLSDEAG